MAGGDLGLLLGNPPLNLLAQHPKCQRTALQQHSMKCRQVKALAKGLFRLSTQLEDLKLTNLVAQRLAWPGDGSRTAAAAAAA